MTGEGFVHDGDAGGRFAVGLGEISTVAQGDSHRGEIPGRDFAIVNVVPFGVARTDQLDAVVAAALERQSGGNDARSFDTWNGLEARDQSVIEIFDLRRRGVA